ncbi:MAG: hypothetical protein RLP44_13005 [Aggregatilineales bacterium]
MERWIIVLLFLFGIAFSCAIPFSLTPFSEDLDDPETSADLISDESTLEIDIEYEGGFYTEAFDYSPDAPNIRHYVLVVPESEIERATEDALWIFISLLPQNDGSTLMREDRIEDYGWALEYLYDAPNAIFTGTFEPGTYGVATAFIAAAIPREDAEVGDDAVLWAGVTGGGANTDIVPVQLPAGETIALDVMMGDSDGWACPWLYVYDGENYVRYAEILRNLRGIENAQSEVTDLIHYTVVDGEIHLRIVEEKDEISYIDSFYLLVDGAPIYADDPRLRNNDANYVILQRGDSLDLSFSVNVESDTVIQVIASGYYETVE